jgi:hypothetical protein
MFLTDPTSFFQYTTSFIARVKQLAKLYFVHFIICVPRWQVGQTK